jgi:hypothetical protein
MRVRAVLFCVAVLVLAGCGPGQETEPRDGWISPLPHGAKGYELYSWRPAGQQEWTYVLISGTNRLKNLEEVTSLEEVVEEAGWVRIPVQGLDGLKDLLHRLPRGEQITWIQAAGPAEGVSEAEQIGLPEPEIVQEIQEHCQRIGVQLSVAARPLSDR